MRLFVSVDLPETLAESIADLQATFAEASGLDFTDPTQAHITMKFLGDTEPKRVNTVADALETAIENAAVEPFEATFEGVGVFPSLDYISVLWLGVSQGSEPLRALHESIEDRMVSLGFDPEDHDFTPHVTLARMHHAGGKELVQEQVQTLEPVVGSMTVDSVSLTESTLTSDGPVYETVHSVNV